MKGAEMKNKYIMLKLMNIIKKKSNRLKNFQNIRIWSLITTEKLWILLIQRKMLKDWN